MTFIYMSRVVKITKDIIAVISHGRLYGVVGSSPACVIYTYRFLDQEKMDTNREYYRRARREVFHP